MVALSAALQHSHVQNVDLLKCLPIVKQAQFINGGNAHARAVDITGVLNLYKIDLITKTQEILHLRKLFPKNREPVFFCGTFVASALLTYSHRKMKKYY